MKFLVRRAPVVAVVRAGAADVAIGGFRVLRGAGFLGAAEAELLPPGFGPNSESRFAFALRL